MKAEKVSRDTRMDDGIPREALGLRDEWVDRWVLGQDARE